MTLASTAPAAAAPGASGPLLGGYRLVRTLGTGPRATVHLGHVDGHPQVAVKEYAAAVPPERIEQEAEALMRAAGEHVVRLVDLALDPRGRPALLLERIAGPSLGTLLERRRSIRPGEAVTVLAPLAATLARMHGSGVVHGGLDPATVLFTDTGSPTLVGFGDAEVLDVEATGRARVAARTESLARDEAALRRLVLRVLDATDAGSPAEADAAQALRSLGESEAPGYPERLASAVFDLADPEPVDLDTSVRSAAALPARLAAGDRAPADAAAAPRGIVLDALQLPEWLRRILGGAPTAVLLRLRSAAASVRRPFWVAGGVAAAAVTVVLLLEPTDPPPSSTAPSSSGLPAAQGVPSSPPSTPTEESLVGDDPAAAATALLTLRAECFRELSVLCLDSVDQVDSSAAVADTSAILTAQESGELAPDGVIVDGPAEVVERLGDTALVRITPPDAEPASVLVIRTEAGWRIRGFPGAARSAAAER